MLQAVVMAGGRGERLLPLTATRPKPLVPFFGTPLLGHLLLHLAHLGVDEVFVTAGHLGEQIAAYLESASPGNMSVRCVIERQARGTAGAVLDLLPELHSPFLVVSGDAVMDLDLPHLCSCHRESGSVATLCLAPPGERLRFGTVARDGRRVVGFVEKPLLSELVPGAGVNAGCYLLEAAALEGFPAQRPLDFGMDVFPQLLRLGRPLAAVQAMRRWRDVGTLESYRQAHFEALTGRADTGWFPEHLVVVPDSGGRPVVCSPDVQLSPGAILEGPAVLGPGCHVGPGARVARSVLLAGCHVRRGATVRDAVLDSNTVVGTGRQVVGGGLGGGRAPMVRALRHRARATAHGEALPGTPQDSLVAVAPSQ